MSAPRLFDPSPWEVVVPSGNARFVSPLRYPGGKSALVPTMLGWLAANQPDVLIEPFAGGASVGISAARWSKVRRVVLVERDPDVAVFWRTVTDPVGYRRLVDKVLGFVPTVENVQRVVERPVRSTVAAAFVTLVRNRCSRAGIIAVNGGLLRHGENGRGIGSRWYPQTLAARIRTVAELAAAGRLVFVEGDGLEYVEQHTGENVAVFADPPYSVGGGRSPGARLYNTWDVDHERLARFAACAPGPVVVCWDDTPGTRGLAAGHGLVVRSWQARSAHHRACDELLVARPGMLPDLILS